MKTWLDLLQRTPISPQSVSALVAYKFAECAEPERPPNTSCWRTERWPRRCSPFRDSFRHYSTGNTGNRWLAEMWCTLEAPGPLDYPDGAWGVWVEIWISKCCGQSHHTNVNWNAITQICMDEIKNCANRIGSYASLNSFAKFITRLWYWIRSRSSAVGPESSSAPRLKRSNGNERNRFCTTMKWPLKLKELA